MNRNIMPGYCERINHKITDVYLWGIEHNNKTIVTRVKLFNKKNNCRKDSWCNRQLSEYAELIREFLNGKRYDLSQIPLEMTDFTNFECDVLNAARKIPFGETVSYSKLASMAGYPKAVRAAASVMRKNRFPLVIPCHRVIRKNGFTGGFHGEQSGEAVELKKKLIEMEKN